MIFLVTIVLFWGTTNHAHTVQNLTDKCYMCSGGSTDWLFHHLSPSPLRPPYPLRHNVEIRPINNPSMTSKCSSERKSLTSVTSSKKLEWLSLVSIALHSVMSDCCDPMDCSPPGSSVHEILQARILEWVAISSSISSQPSDRNHVSYISCIGRWVLYHCTTWEHV